MPTARREHASAVRAPAMDEIAKAYADTVADIEALPPDQVGRVNADIPTAVSLALGALPLITSLEDAMAEALKHPPTAQIARLRPRALALLFTHLHAAPRSSKSHETDLEDARVLRERLLASADAHVAHGQLDRESVAKIREGSGHLDRANDLIALAALFRAAWPQISSRTQVELAHLDRASALGTLLVTELGAKALGAGPAADSRVWSDRRARAYRLFMRDYDEIRRAVEYVRYHEDDAAAFTPPLRPYTRGSADDGGENPPAADPQPTPPTT